MPEDIVQTLQALQAKLTELQNTPSPSIKNRIALRDKFITLRNQAITEKNDDIKKEAVKAICMLMQPTLNQDPPLELNNPFLFYQAAQRNDRIGLKFLLHLYPRTFDINQTIREAAQADITPLILLDPQNICPNSELQQMTSDIAICYWETYKNKLNHDQYKQLLKILVNPSNFLDQENHLKVIDYFDEKLNQSKDKALTDLMEHEFGSIIIGVNPSSNPLSDILKQSPLFFKPVYRYITKFIEHDYTLKVSSDPHDRLFSKLQIAGFFLTLHEQLNHLTEYHAFINQVCAQLENLMLVLAKDKDFILKLKKELNNSLGLHFFYHFIKRAIEKPLSQILRILPQLFDAEISPPFLPPFSFSLQQLSSLTSPLLKNLISELGYNTLIHFIWTKNLESLKDQYEFIEPLLNNHIRSGLIKQALSMYMANQDKQAETILMFVLEKRVNSAFKTGALVIITEITYNHFDDKILSQLQALLTSKLATRYQSLKKHHKTNYQSQSIKEHYLFNIKIILKNISANPTEELKELMHQINNDELAEPCQAFTPAPTTSTCVEVPKPSYVKHQKSTMNPDKAASTPKVPPLNLNRSTLFCPCPYSFPPKKGTLPSNEGPHPVDQIEPSESVLSTKMPLFILDRPKTPPRYPYSFPPKKDARPDSKLPHTEETPLSFSGTPKP